MTKKLLFTAIALCAGAFAHAGTIAVIDASKFVNPTIERFTDSPVKQATYEFGNGLTYTSLDQGGSDFVKTNEFYSFGSFGGGVAGGNEDDWFFATDITAEKTSSSFEFRFAGGATRFGFAGGESAGGDISLDDGIMDLEFYDLTDARIDPSFLQADNGGLFSLSDFNSFEVSSGAIGRVVFRNVGHVVLDDVTFEGAAAAAVPEPASIALLGLGLAGFAVARRKHARK